MPFPDLCFLLGFGSAEFASVCGSLSGACEPEGIHPSHKVIFSKTLNHLIAPRSGGHGRASSKPVSDRSDRTKR